jgi:hypothetical protein
MDTKLTLRLDETLIRSAKRHSAATGKSVSRLVADYFALIDAADRQGAGELTPRVRSLVGALAGATANEQDYGDHLLDKHQ